MVKLIGISGKIASGKDYLAQKLQESLKTQGLESDSTAFAKSIKNELDIIIQAIRAARSTGWAKVMTGLYLNEHSDDSKQIVDYLYDEVRADGSITAYSRTGSVRSALQLLGVTRRIQSDCYWTNKFISDVLKSYEHNTFVLVTDVRMPDEAQTIKDAGGYLIRLEPSDEVLEERRLNRDGITYTLEQLFHPTETALDRYEGFDQVITELPDHSRLTINILNYFNNKGETK